MITGIDRNREGAWRISAYVGEGIDEYLFIKCYYFYSKREAIRLFKEEIAKLR